MTVAFLTSLKAQLTRGGGRITATGVQRLLVTAGDEFKVDKRERAWLAELATQDVFDAPATLALFRAALAGLPPLPNFSGQVSGLAMGPYAEHLNDDELFLGRDGVVNWDTGLQPFSRSYLPISEGPLRHRHGSAVPSSTALSEDARAATSARTPGQSLNAAAASKGVTLPDLDALFNGRRFYNPSASDWEGACHSWTPLSLHPRLNQLVDVAGPEGARGVWYGDQFFSRAELGNVAMALADTITNSPLAREYGDNFVTALDVLKTAQLYLGDRPVGFQADVWNDVDRGSNQVWNQPFSRGSLAAQTLSGPAAEAVLALAANDAAIADKSALLGGTARVKQVTFSGTYGKEVADDWEGAPATESREWTMYAVTDEDGRVLNAYNASDRRLARAPVPTHGSSELPDFLVRPNLSFVDDAFSGRPNALIDRDPSGKAFRFLLAEVLARGVPASRRTAFEQEVSALPAGAIAPQTAAALAHKYPGMAAGYTAESWQRTFGFRGLTASQFGA